MAQARDENRVHPILPCPVPSHLYYKCLHLRCQGSKNVFQKHNQYYCRLLFCCSFAHVCFGGSKEINMWFELQNRMAFFLRGVALGLDIRQWSANWFSFFQSYVKELHFFKHYPVYTVYCLAGITLDGHDDLEGVTERLYIKQYMLRHFKNPPSPSRQRFGTRYANTSSHCSLGINCITHSWH